MPLILPPPPTTLNLLLNVQRLLAHQYRYPELKDPSIVQVADGSYLMYASIGNSYSQQWIVGRFVAQSPDGPWQEVSPVTFHNLVGPQLCAPAVRFELNDGQPHWTMYVQTSCFEHEGVIALATSTDGEHFYGSEQPLVTRQMMGQYADQLVGLYDAGISETVVNGEALLCLLFSGYRRIGCGDLYMTYRKKSATEADWEPSQRILSQEEVPFHKDPTAQDFEWGLEGAQIIQLAEKSFLLVGVCFMSQPGLLLGTRQRVFFAHATSVLGPWMPITTPFEPQDYAGSRGENGHPDAFIRDGQLWVVYQERCGQGYPWHFRVATFDVAQLAEYFQSLQTVQLTDQHALPTAVPNYPSLSL